MPGRRSASAANGELLGLEMEDTVAHYDTLDGHTLVEPSNKVCLYSPRFGAVRQVVDVEIDQQRNRATGVAEPVKPLVPRTSEPVASEHAESPGRRATSARTRP